MISMAHVEQRIGKILSQDMALEVPSSDTNLIGEGLIDSMTFIDLLQRLEGEFGIRFQLDELDLDQFRTIAQMASFVSRTAQAPAA
ncbi:MAG: acyl carrier protein [Minicystis sp.]